MATRVPDGFAVAGPSVAETAGKKTAAAPEGEKPRGGDVEISLVAYAPEVSCRLFPFFSSLILFFLVLPCPAQEKTQKPKKEEEFDPVPSKVKPAPKVGDEDKPAKPKDKKDKKPKARHDEEPRPGA